MSLYKSDFSGAQIQVAQAHQFLRYREMFPLYDRVAPFAANFFDAKNVLDLGANIGDSLVDFVKLENRYVHCVEGEQKYFRELEANLAFLHAQGFTSNKAYNLVIGQGQLAIHANNGTGSIYESEGGGEAVPIIELLERLGSIPDFIKCDFDGYDAVALGPVVLDAARHETKIFLECDYRTSSQRSSYEKFFDALFSHGASVIFFDNFGSPYGIARSFFDVVFLFDSLDCQRKFPSAPKVYYFDALVVWDEVTPKIFMKEFKNYFFKTF